MIIKYFDVNSVLIDNFLLVDCFHKVYYDDNFCFLKIETYDKNKIVNLHYFIKDKLFLNQIFEEYYYLDVITISFVIEIKGKYLMCESFEYENRTSLQNKRIQTYRNDLIFPIYDCIIDGFIKKEWKYYYDIERNITYEFDYDKNGNFERLTIFDSTFFYDTERHTIYPNEIGLGKNHFNFSFDNFKYYINTNSIIPSE